jgi:hypothetical protein
MPTGKMLAHLLFVRVTQSPKSKVSRESDCSRAMLSPSLVSLVDESKRRVLSDLLCRSDKEIVEDTIQSSLSVVDRWRLSEVSVDEIGVEELVEDVEDDLSSDCRMAAVNSSRVISPTLGDKVEEDLVVLLLFCCCMAARKRLTASSLFLLSTLVHWVKRCPCLPQNAHLLPGDRLPLLNLQCKTLCL